MPSVWFFPGFCPVAPGREGKGEGGAWGRALVTRLRIVTKSITMENFSNEKDSQFAVLTS